MKKILITGSTGFIGRNLTEYLLKCGYEVYVPKRDELDLTDELQVNQYLQMHHFDVVLHAANTRMSNAKDYEVFNTNLRMFYIFEKYRDKYGKMLYFGSGNEYDREIMSPLVKEDQFGNSIPKDSYGFTKYLMRKTASLDNNIYDLCIFAVFGKYEEWERRFISNNMVRSLKNMPMTLSQNVYFDYLYIDDLCRIVEWFIENEQKYKHYNVCTSQRVDLLSLAHMINEVSGLNREIIVKEEGWKSEYSGDNSRLMKEMEGFAFTDMKQAMHELWEYYKEHIDEIDESRLQ